MSVFRKDKSVTSDADVLRFVYEPNAAKKIAREFGVAVVTAKVWLAGRFPVARREQLAAHIQARLDERDAISAEIRRRWSGGNSNETSKATRALDDRRSVEIAPPGDRLGGKVKRG